MPTTVNPPKQEATQILSETGRKNSLHPQSSAARPVLSKHRITSILRNTYNQARSVTSFAMVLKAIVLQ